MTVDEFIEKLKAGHGKFRCKDKELRVALTNGDWGYDCPITYVARIEGIDCDMDLYEDAGDDLGLEEDAVHAIANAADGDFFPLCEYDIRDIRRRMFEAVGLEGKL